ncbi:DUF817 domain-containing protein [Novosphingobium sp. YJ-S2-02]|uniref:DUF817 domain-containing protein n=1 Tax=Novosphingobium aureum TaxID=2792964 RepID=A0A931HCY3_9SPHN|nr:DUF817 domain-containing protein [Novosphingobium aureum]MBH0113136.1 DUF817 domain-containing protein [Novosphingobium aureum]
MEPFVTGQAHTRFAAVRDRLEAFSPRPGWRAWLYEFLLFGFKQGWACLFGGLMLALLLATHLFYPEGAALARYDFLTLAALTIQLGMLALRLETLDEAKVILAFHLVGTVMELFKTAVGSWEYPGDAVLRIGAVPLFSGFMYAAVGSYIARIWRIFDFRFTAYPPRWATLVLAIAVYVNFFAHHWLPDVRIALFAALALVFARTRIWFRVWREDRWMPLLLGWFLVALFIWLAENLGTFAQAWTYPDQRAGWSMVHFGKLGAWYLLMYISFVLVAVVHRPMPRLFAVTIPEKKATSCS